MLSTPTLRRLALVAATALVAGAAALAPAVPAQAADATVQVQGPTEVLLGNSVVTADFSVTINGTVTDYQASVQVLKKTVKKPVLPTIASKPALTLAQALPVSLTLGNTVSPGRYQLTVQALNGTAVVATAVAVFVVEASPDSTWSQVTTRTIYYHYGKSKIKVKWAGPAYLKGARITFYYQKPGKVSFSKIGSKKIDSKGRVTFKTKKVLVAVGAAYRVKVGGTPFAAAFVIPGQIG
jgi:hypothetical protein